MLEKYFTITEQDAVMRSDRQTEFFTDLHETLQTQVFDGTNLRYEEVDGESAEVRLPDAEELIEYVSLEVKNDAVIVLGRFPATIIGTGDEGTWQEHWEYTPPNA